MAWMQDWGQMSVSKDAQGGLEAVLENSRMRVRYGLQYKGEGAEGNITELVAKSAPGMNQAGHAVDAAAWRDSLVGASVNHDGPDVKTLRLEWGGKRGFPGAVSEVSIYEGSAFVRIDYLSWCVNIVDIGHPGETVTGGEYAIYGAGEWKRAPLLYPQVYFDRWPGDVGHENVTEVDEPGPLDYRGWFIMGTYNPGNGFGFGRVVPVEAIDVIKLLKFDRDGMGFELFPYFHRPHQPFTGYLYVVTGGAEEIIALGKRLADSI